MSVGVLTEPQGSLETRHIRDAAQTGARASPAQRGVNVGGTQIYPRAADARALIQTP